SLRRGASRRDAARVVKGQGWPLYDDPRSGDGANEPRRSRGRMQGQAFLVTFFATEKSDSPSRAKPAPSSNSINDHESETFIQPPNLASRCPPQTSFRIRLAPSEHLQHPARLALRHYTHVYSGNITVTRPTTVLGNFCIDGRSILPTC